jgi:hypothetical protein
MNENRNRQNESNNAVEAPHSQQDIPDMERPENNPSAEKTFADIYIQDLKEKYGEEIKNELKIEDFSLQSSKLAACNRPNSLPKKMTLRVIDNQGVMVGFLKLTNKFSLKVEEDSNYKEIAVSVSKYNIKAFEMPKTAKSKINTMFRQYTGGADVTEKELNRFFDELKSLVELE